VSEHDGRDEVVVTDIRMPFLSMVVFLVKLAVAAIPAMIILSLIGMLVSMIVGATFHGLIGDMPGEGMRRF
jgi:hypothetical protein